MTAVQLLAAALPLAVVTVLLVVVLWPATRVMPVAWLSAVAVGYLVWGMPVRWVIAASMEGLMVAVQILWIVFAARVLLYTMMRSGAFDVLNRNFATISDDPRVQVVLVGFLLATFLEGVAGFDTPAAVVAPLLFALGFPALAAVVVALIGHVIAVTYRAVGTPIVIGIAEPMQGVSTIRTAIEAQGLTTAEFALGVARWAATGSIARVPTSNATDTRYGAHARTSPIDGGSIGTASVPVLSALRSLSAALSPLCPLSAAFRPPGSIVPTQ